MEDTFKYEFLDTSKLMFQPTMTLPNQNYSITFHRAGDNGFIAQEVGRLDFNGPAMAFEGDAEESAKLFFDWVAQAFAARLKEEYQRGYEDCLTEEAKK